MARHDLQCLKCGLVQEDVNISVQVGARLYCRTHWCPRCQGRVEPVPAFNLSLFSDAGTDKPGRTNFEKFSLPVEDPGAPGGFRQETIASLHDVRRLERESEQRARNGEGRTMVWRDYSQDANNRDVHTLGQDPSLTPSKTYVNGTPVAIRRGDPVIADHGTVEEAEG